MRLLKQQEEVLHSSPIPTVADQRGEAMEVVLGTSIPAAEPINDNPRQDIEKHREAAEIELGTKQQQDAQNEFQPPNLGDHLEAATKVGIESSNKLKLLMKKNQLRRLTSHAIKDHKERKMMEAVKGKREDGLEVKTVPGKGRAVFTTRSFNRGDFLVEYAGDLIAKDVAAQREMMYAARDPTGTSFMFYFRHNDKLWW